MASFLRRALSLIQYALDELVGRLVALCLLPIRPLVRFRLSRWDGPEIWLIGENQGELLHDNGYAFFQYCRRRNPDMRVYFLLKSFETYRKAGLFDDRHVVRYGSMRHMFLFVQANRGFYTHTYRDLMFRRFFEVFGRGIDLVYLHHGALGFKKFNSFYHKHRNAMRLFTVGSELERNILVEQAEVDADRVQVTGYARFDKMENRVPERSPRKILYMPTHRNYLLDSGDVGSYLVRISSLASNPRLQELLVRNGLELVVYMHKQMQPYTEQLPEFSTAVRVVRFGDRSPAELLAEGSLLITDYSSVCWDFFFLGKPIVFYRFDIEEYLADRSSYLELADGIVGKVAIDEDTLVQYVYEQVESDFELSNDIGELRKTIMPRMDGSSCRRIYDAVLSGAPDAQ